MKGGEEGILPRAFNDAGQHDFMALIEFRKAAIGAEVGRILRSIIAVEIRGGVKAFAKGVVAKQGEVIAEALLEFQNSGLRNGVSSGTARIGFVAQPMDK